MKKKVGLFLSIFFLVVLLFSCSQNTSEKSSDNESKSNKQKVSTTTPVDEPKTTPVEKPETPPVDEPEIPPVDEPAITFNAGDTALAKIKIGNVEFDKTEQVYVTGMEGAIIVGENPDNWPKLVTSENSYGSFSTVFLPGRTVKLNPYIIGKYTVTQELYTAVMSNQVVTIQGIDYTLTDFPFYCTEEGNFDSSAITGINPIESGEIQKYRPAEGMNWFDAVFFCNKLSEMTGLQNAYEIIINSVSIRNHIAEAEVQLIPNSNGYRLPTEAEWEFAARGGDTSREDWYYLFSGCPLADGESLDEQINTLLNDYAWYGGNSGRKSHEVGLKKPNALGIYDMSGNVWEWCYDIFNDDVVINDNIVDGIVENPIGANSGSTRICKGGNWHDTPIASTVYFRYRTLQPTGLSKQLGFRVVRSVILDEK